MTPDAIFGLVTEYVAWPTDEVAAVSPADSEAENGSLDGRYMEE
jgi:hypothetical protein